MLKSVMNNIARMLIVVPYFPKLKGPLGKCCRWVRALAKDGIA